jgi:hypothetical protein
LSSFSTFDKALMTNFVLIGRLNIRILARTCGREVVRASKRGVGAVLLQGDNWKTASPCGFHSREYIPPELNYQTHERSCWQSLPRSRRGEGAYPNLRLGSFVPYHKCSAQTKIGKTDCTVYYYE